MDRIPPQNIEAEQSVLGAMLMDKNAIIDVAVILRPEYFYDTRHRDIYQVVIDLFEEGMPVDMITVSDKLRSRKQLKKIGGQTYLADLVSSVPTSAHAEEYAIIVQGNALRRDLISSASKITELSFDKELEVQTVVDKSEQLLFSVAQKGVRSNFVHIKDLLKAAYERAEKADQNESLGISTGFRKLDKLLGGFQKSDLVILAARPSVGKTSLSLDFARTACIFEKKRALYFSLEMGNTQITDRLVGMQANIPFWEIRTGNLNDEKFMKLADAMGELSEAELYIDDKPGQSINELRTKARRMAVERGVDIIFVDYLQLLHADNAKDGRTQEVSMISQGLKNMARELEVPVIALSQLSRAIESRQNRRPQLSDLRESGSIEQDADIVMFIDREETYNPDTERKGLADLFVAKHRNGPTGNVELAWVSDIASYRNLYKEGEDKDE